MGELLPIEGIRAELAPALDRGPVVISSPTGSGKSTQVPRCLPGPVLVVEPRRVACRSLAQRVAELEATPLGQAVGYHVRDDRRISDETRIVFATPGIVLRSLDELRRYKTIILDEFHERSLEVDLLFALLRSRTERLVVMSATLEGDRVASALGGQHLRAQGRLHPVELVYRPDGVLLPTGQDLQPRLARALDDALKETGDVLVFLPGKAEIASAMQTLQGHSADLIPLHGGLSLTEQARAFAPAKRRKIILATNVAETSVTVPGIGVVVDSGLVRRTRYHYGRSYLTRTPIALDSAEQRRGRAGRTGPGVCIRLWSEAARLQPTTPPEIHRESLVPLVLAAAAAGAQPQPLPFLDVPKTHALDAAIGDLRALGAVDEIGAITRCGSELFGLPLDPGLGRLLVESRDTGAVQDAVDLVAALAVGRPLFTGPANDEDPLRQLPCDATAMIVAVRQGDRRTPGLSLPAVQEARSNARRLRKALQVPELADPRARVDRSALAQSAIGADPRCVYVARKRNKRIVFNNGGTEVSLARDSLVLRDGTPDAIAVLDTRGISDRHGRAQLLATCAMPLRLAQLKAAGLGQDRLRGVRVESGQVVATVERVYAKKVLDCHDSVPEGAMAREAIAELFVRGSLFRAERDEAALRLQSSALARRLLRRRMLVGLDETLIPEEPPELMDWVLRRLEDLGLQSGADLPLLSPQDLVPEALPYELQTRLEREFPLTIDLGDAVYRVEYDLGKRRAALHIIRGDRSKPPPRRFLPALGGFQVLIEAGGKMHLLR